MSDKILSLEKEKVYPILNSGDAGGNLAGGLGASKDSIGLASELIGLALMAANPVTAGAFV